MKPFLILQLRPIDLASDDEFTAFLRYGELAEHQVRRIRMDKGGIPNINIDDYSGIIIGGGPSNVSDPEHIKLEYQKRFEKDLYNLLEVVFKRDVPVLGSCYGIGAITKFMGGKVSREKYSEGIGAVEIELNENGRADEILEGIPDKFMAYVGHKEACQVLPPEATLLAGSKTCPVQMIRVQENIYATQFHPELDADGIGLRINVYRDHGYFSPEDTALLIENSKKDKVHIPNRILRNFIRKYVQA